MADLMVLEALLAAADKQFVQALFNQVFAARNGAAGVFPRSRTKEVATALNIDLDQTNELVKVIGSLIEEVLFENVPSPKVLEMLPSGMNANLKKLVATIIHKSRDEWSQGQILQEASLPKVQAVDWRVDVQTASDATLKMARPSVFVSIQCQGQQTKAGRTPEPNTTCFEMNKETLDTMLDGLGKIQQQLASVAN